MTTGVDADLLDQDHYAVHGPPHATLPPLARRGTRVLARASGRRRLLGDHPLPRPVRHLARPEDVLLQRRGAIMRPWKEEEYEPQQEHAHQPRSAGAHASTAAREPRLLRPHDPAARGARARHHHEHPRSGRRAPGSATSSTPSPPSCRCGSSSSWSGVPVDGPAPGAPVEQPDDRLRRSGVPDRSDGAPHRRGRALHVRQRARRRPQRQSARRSRERAHAGRGRRQPPLARRSSTPSSCSSWSPATRRPAT